MSSQELYERNYFYLSKELHLLVRKVDVKAGDIGTNMKPVQRKDIETNMKRYWDKYENIMQQIWKDIGINMKRYWDKYETCAKKIHWDK